jgi:signal transduction histidine kinase
MRLRTRRARDASSVAETERELDAVKAARDRFLVELVNARESEARRISYLLHDDVVQQLTALQLRLELAAMKHDIPQLGSLSQDTAQVIASIRRLLIELHPQILESQGLGPAIEVVADALRERGIEVLVQPFPHRLPIEVEALAYRLVQESLTNVLEHSGATRADVELSLSDGRLRAEISDNGEGFVSTAVSDAERKGAVGLYVARERAELVGGRFFVRSSIGNGTNVAFELPVPDEAPAEVAAP